VIQYGQLLYQNMNDPLEISLRIACASPVQPWLE